MCLQVKYAVAGSNESSDLLVEGQFEKSNIVEHWVFCVPQTTVAVNHCALAQYIKDDPDLDADKILLLSCSNFTAAQNLANKIGKRVIATDGIVRIYSDGGILSFNNGVKDKFEECVPDASRIPVTQPRAPSSETLAYVSMGGVVDEVEDLLNRHVNINNLSNPPAGYQFFTLNGRKYIKRIDTNSNLKRLTVDENNIIVEYDGSQRISVPGNLARNLGPAPSNHQAHHLIPDAVVRTHWFYVAVRARQGNTYDLDRASNGIYMANAEEFFIDGISKQYPTHNGSHNKYNNLIVQYIDNSLAAKGYNQSNFSSLNDQQIDAFLSEMEDVAIDIIILWSTSRLD